MCRAGWRVTVTAHLDCRRGTHPEPGRRLARHEFAFKDGHDRVGTEILKYVPDLERRLKENRIQLEGDAGVRYGSG